MNEDGDRLSSLSDNVIHKIFSSISTKLVVQTSVFSSRWRFIWTSIPYLNISSKEFSTLPKFYEFVTHVLSRHNNKIDAFSVKISLPRPAYLSVPSLQNPGGKSIWELPALTTLYLCNVDLSNNDINSLFSKCASLKILTLKSCRIVNSKSFSICHPRLSNLTLDNSFMGKFVNVVAPNLENLTIKNWEGGMKEYFVEISAPDLTSFVYWGKSDSLSLSTDGFNSLEEADIYVSKPRYEHILCLLQHIHNVKFLTVNIEILEHLSSCAERFLLQPFVFTNLNRLKICPQSVFSQGQAPNKSYYLDSSPGATLEEIVAQILMGELQVLLEEEKTNTKTNMTRMERGKDPIESHDAKMLEPGTSQVETNLLIVKSMTKKIESCMEHLRVQVHKRKSKYYLIVSKLQKIEEVLTKLPASKRDLIQPCLDSLYAEAVIVMGGITDLMKARCDQNESRMSVYVQELATAMKPRLINKSYVLDFPYTCKP